MSYGSIIELNYHDNETVTGLVNSINDLETNVLEQYERENYTVEG